MERLWFAKAIFGLYNTSVIITQKTCKLKQFGKKNTICHQQITSTKQKTHFLRNNMERVNGTGLDQDKKTPPDMFPAVGIKRMYQAQEAKL